MSQFFEFFPNLNILIASFQVQDSCNFLLFQNLLNLKIIKILSCKTENSKLVLKLKVEKQDLIKTLSGTCLDCKCSQKLTKFDEKTVLNLPSDFWFEMTDCWACHREDYTTLKGQEAGLITPKQDVLMDGIAYFLLHPKNLDLEKIQIRLTGREVSAATRI
jgi:hypothetical protein